jgi:hypothetical protein
MHELMLGGAMDAVLSIVDTRSHWPQGHLFGELHRHGGIYLQHCQNSSQSRLANSAGRRWQAVLLPRRVHVAALERSGLKSQLRRLVRLAEDRVTLAVARWVAGYLTKSYQRHIGCGIGSSGSRLASPNAKRLVACERLWIMRSTRSYPGIMARSDFAAPARMFICRERVRTKSSLRGPTLLLRTLSPLPRKCPPLRLHAPPIMRCGLPLLTLEIVNEVCGGGLLLLLASGACWRVGL